MRHRLSLAFCAVMLSTIPAYIVSGFVEDKDDKKSVTLVVWAIFALPGSLLLGEVIKPK